MDGNGRWAKIQNKPRIYGHKQGIKTVKDTIKSCIDIGISYLTLYAFSKENWSRPKDEVDSLMSIFTEALVSESSLILENNIKLITIGDIDSLPKKCRNNLLNLIDKSKNNDRFCLIIALSYSGRWEISNAAKKLSKDVIEGKINVDKIDEDIFCKYLQTQKVPYPDILIRTGGDFRVSNFLLWQIAYTEIFILDKMWPDFDKKTLISTINSYNNKERRFGMISEQITP